MSGPGAHHRNGHGLDRRCGFDAPRRAPGAVVFGRRQPSPAMDIWLRRVRLELLAAELDQLFAREGGEPFCVFTDDRRLSLAVGRAVGLVLTIGIEPAKGHFVLDEGGARASTTLTSSDQRVIDIVAGAMASASDERMPRLADAAVDALVGRSLEEVETRLILRTLLHFKGDRLRTAAALGLDERSLRLRLRHLWLPASRPANAAAEARP